MFVEAVNAHGFDYYGFLRREVISVDFTFGSFFT